MINRTTKLRWRRKVRRSRRQVEDIGFQAEEQLERHFFRRLSRLFEVRRFVAGWLALLILLSTAVVLQTKALGSYYKTLQPVPGGSYAEGMLGSFTNANPLYATALVDTTVSRLMFAGLLKYDTNNQLVGDLAAKWSVDGEGKVYTVTLKPHLLWQDGQALTADDVVFTFQTIQNPDARSPLFHSWQGITIKASDNQTVTFTLTNPLAPFIHNLTTGIIPKHILKDVAAVQLRSSSFNTTHPIGAGPFAWGAIEILANGLSANRQNIGLKAFNDYNNGAPKLEQFIVKTYPDQDQLLDGFHKQEFNALVGLDHVPDTLTADKTVQQYGAPLTAETMVFFRVDSDILKDGRIRQALVQAVNVPSLVNGLGYPVIIADEPLLRGQLGYSTGLRQLTPNVDQANKLLDDAGWKRTAPDQVRMNGTNKLVLNLYAQNNADYTYVTQQLQKTWQAIGVDLVVKLLDDSDLQVTVNSRGYDALLYGISIGTDPDVFAYWDSTQADQRSTNRLNFSNYRSQAADRALEAGRSRLDPALRSAKYVPFLQAWRNDTPALALYQPRLLYLTKGQLFGFSPRTINTAADRFANVENWMIRQDTVAKE